MTRRLLALGFGLLLGVALAEAGARWIEPASPTDQMFGLMGDRIDDPVLEHRGRPGTGENDARGYRNARALERVEVVALGDSQTWGVNAAIDEAWPAVLARASGRSVYNMGRGGYGMLQILYLLDDALALSPEWVVFALYLGNDLYDATALAYAKEAHAARRSDDPELLAALARRESPSPQQMFFDRLAYQRASPGLLRWLEENSALGRLVARATLAPADTQADRAWAADHPEDGFLYEVGELSTVFDASYRLTAVDTSRPRIREGLRITQEALEDAAERVARAPGVNLLVVLLPTKERVFAPAVARAGVPVPVRYLEAVSAEFRVARELERSMRARGIAFLDVLPALEEAVARGEPIYPANADGHFTAAGYRVIGEAVAARIEGKTGQARKEYNRGHAARGPDAVREE